MRVRSYSIFLRKQSAIRIDRRRNQDLIFDVQYRAAHGAIGQNQPTTDVVLIAKGELSAV